MPKTNRLPADNGEFGARAAWDYGILSDHFRTEILSARLHGDRIVIDWPPTDGETAQTILTKSRWSIYNGESIWAASTSKEKSASVEAVLYSNETGHILVGQESWNSGLTDWFIVQFSPGPATKRRT